MRIVYSRDATAPSVTVRSLAASAASPAVSRTHTVTGLALVGCTLPGGCTIQASTDGFAHTVYNHALDAVSGNLILDLTATPVVAASWRIVNGASAGSYGLLFPGVLIAITNPAYPYESAPGVIAEDRETLGGARYSRIRHVAWLASMTWPYVRDGERPVWQGWHDATLGFRRPFVVEESPQIGADIHLATAPVSAFPLQRNVYSGNTANLSFKGVPVV